MASLAEIRAKYPQYDDMSDQQLADAFHAKFYSDMPRAEFDAKIGMANQRIAGAFEDAARQPPAQPTSMGMDVAKSGASGLARGVADVAGLPGSIGDALGMGLGYLGRKGFEAVTGREPQFASGGIESFFSSGPEGAQRQSAVSGNSMRGYLTEATGGASDYQPQTRAGKYAATVGEFVPGAVAFGGINPANVARYGVAPALASETAGQLTEGTSAEPYARVGAAIAAPFAVGGAGRLVSPYAASGGKARQEAVKLLEAEGIPISAGQKTGNQSLKYREAEMGGDAAANLVETQGRAFTRAVLKRIGVNADEASPDVIQQAADDIGARFNQLSANNNIGYDGKMVRDILAVRKRYNQDVPAMSRTGTLDSAIEEVANALKANRAVPGQLYQNLRSSVGKVMRTSAASNPQTFRALKDFTNALDDAMERSIQRANPSQLGEWKKARGLYKNLLTVERAATGAGENAALGIISPAQLKNATIQVGGRKNYARGKGDFAKLARAGEATLKPLPQSGTAPRLKASMVPGALGAASGAGVGGYAGGDPASAAAGALLGAFAPRLLGAGMMSRPGQAYLGNQIMPNISAGTRQQLPLSALAISRDGQGNR